MNNIIQDFKDSKIVLNFYSDIEFNQAKECLKSNGIYDLEHYIYIEGDNNIYYDNNTLICGCSYPMTTEYTFMTVDQFKNSIKTNSPQNINPHQSRQDSQYYDMVDIIIKIVKGE